MLLFCGIAEAKVNSYMGVSANVGEWSMLPVESAYTPSLGAAGGVGFVYELQAGKTYSPTRFLFQVGVNAQGGTSSFAQAGNTVDSLPNQLDLDNYRFDYVYEVSGRHDQYTKIAAQIPLLVGFQTKAFYMLAGVKAGFNIYKKMHTTATVSTYGAYRDFDDHRHMPEYQFFDNKPYRGSTEAAMQLDLDASLELGGRLGVMTEESGFGVPRSTTEWRLGAFVDYGLKDLRSTKNANRGKLDMPAYDAQKAYNPEGTNQSMIDNLKMSDLMASEGFARSVNNLVVGIKLTVLFRLPEDERCVICRDAYGSSVGLRRGGGVKYEE